VDISNSSLLASPSLDAGNQEADASETVEPPAASKPEVWRLPEGIEDGLNDPVCDDVSDISNLSKEDVFEIHSKMAEQRNTYRRKCVQVGAFVLF